MSDDVHDIGTRVRELRSWRGQTLRTLADLAGISYGQLGKIERGERPVDSRRVMESLAQALRVSPAELLGQPWLNSDNDTAEAHAGAVEIESAMDLADLGHDPGVAVRTWPEIQADIDRLVNLMHVTADYHGQTALVPRLLPELHAAFVRQPRHRAAALLGLIHCYSSVAFSMKRVSGRGLPMLAARLAQQAADELGAPQWRAYATWLRGDAVGQLSRPAQLRRAVAMADEMQAEMRDGEVGQAVGMLHLSAALAAAAGGDRDTADTHLGEAEAIASKQASEVGEFAHLFFGAPNVGIWRTSMAAEFGDGPKVAEVARLVNIDVIPSQSRRAEFLSDVGRSLLVSRITRDAGLRTLLQAEQLAPQRVRCDPFVREAVAGDLRRARRDAGGRQLRGLAWRMGVAPTG